MLSSPSSQNLRRHSALLAKLDLSNSSPLSSATSVLGETSLIIRDGFKLDDFQDSGSSTAPTVVSSWLPSSFSTSTTVLTESSATTSGVPDTSTQSTIPFSLPPTTSSTLYSPVFSTSTPASTEPGSTGPIGPPSFQPSSESESSSPSLSPSPSSTSPSVGSTPFPSSSSLPLSPSTILSFPVPGPSVVADETAPQPPPTTYPNLPQSPISPSPPSSSAHSSSRASNTPIIVASVSIPVLVLCIALLWWRRRRARERDVISSSTSPSQSTLVRSQSSGGKSVGSSFIQYDDSVYYETDFNARRTPDSFWGAPPLPPGTVMDNASEYSFAASGASCDSQSGISYSSERPLL
ncbi:hypothetical protein CONPUDRAFT_169297 [Coniophora puteana RWD-64-598 SS2]|uniref:Uncharacterized protein n=1 Tax=Coniophora puteana (strain RWD-64-598) TaxID=741705 RepID=A0A5M3M830_CONPW|nr:uncharacterized protein CONPUDRAFT_169297 [Coniophora puteana RWD-64-598 SS2]EIW75432.1 hypothetical protein CONPUDRAFT_169297 [Coniophora puteana RWD-64-598 SS2]